MNINKEIKPPSSVDFQKKSPRRPDDRSSSRDAAVAPAATAATELLLLRSSSLRHFSRCRRVAAASLILEVLPSNRPDIGQIDIERLWPKFTGVYTYR